MSENDPKIYNKTRQTLLLLYHTGCGIITRRKFWEGLRNLDYTVALEKTFSVVVADNTGELRNRFHFATTTARSLLHWGAALSNCRASGEKCDNDNKILLFFKIIPGWNGRDFCFRSFQRHIQQKKNFTGNLNYNFATMSFHVRSLRIWF